MLKETAFDNPQVGSGRSTYWANVEHFHLRETAETTENKKRGTKFFWRIFSKAAFAASDEKPSLKPLFLGCDLNASNSPDSASISLNGKGRFFIRRPFSASVGTMAHFTREKTLTWWRNPAGENDHLRIKEKARREQTHAKIFGKNVDNLY